VIINNLHSITHHLQISAGYFISQICAFDMGYLSLTHLLGGTPKLRNIKFGLKKLETPLYHMVQNVFRYLDMFRGG